MKGVGALLVTLAALIGCGSDVGRWIVVKDSALQQGAEHTALRAHPPRQGLGYEGRRFVITGHRISDSNAGYVIAFRRFGSDWPKIDSAQFEKVSIQISGLPVKAGDTIPIGGESKNILFYSAGSSNFPGNNGCFGYAVNGSVRIIEVSNSGIRFSVDAKVELSSPLGASGDCSSMKIEEVASARLVRIGDLTPWEGRASDAIYKESMAN